MRLKLISIRYLMIFDFGQKLQKEKQHLYNMHKNMSNNKENIDKQMRRNYNYNQLEG